jgi:hypothetical protein
MLDWRALTTLIASMLLLGATASPTVAADEPSPADEKVDSAAQRFSVIGTAPLSEPVATRESANPVTSLWLVTLQNDHLPLDGDLPGARGQWSNVFQIAPSIPIPISRSPQLHLLTQLSFPVWWRPGTEETTEPPFFEFDQKSGFGDIVMTNYLARTLRRKQGWVYGVGPTWAFPSASSDFTGDGKYQVGPAVLGGYFEEKRPLWGFVSVQQWWSFAGDSDRDETNKMLLQYSYQLNLDHIDAIGDLPGGEWAIGAAPYVQADWKKDGGQRWSVPIGTGIVFTPWLKIPPRLALEWDYYVARPDSIGPEWDFRLSVTVPIYQNPSFL